MFVEPIDGGLMTMLQWQNWAFWVELLFGNFGYNTWKLGTLYPPAFLHLLQPHEAENRVMNPACEYSSALTTQPPSNQPTAAPAILPRGRLTQSLLLPVLALGP